MSVIGRERNDATQPINKLPDEILAGIFLLYTHMCEYDNLYIKEPSDKNHTYQLTISAVCCRWRSMALKMPQLWSRVTLSDPIPWDRSAFYLARSGSTAPLDIGIDMMEDFWSGVKSGMAGACTELSRKALEFIVSHGGATSRWQSVSIATDLLGPHLAVAEFLRSSSLPELRYLELTSHAPAHFTGLDMMALRTAMNTEPLPLFQDPPSKLCTVKIGGLPNPLLFGHSNQLHLPNLTHLELSFVGSPPKLSDLVALFQATPQLVVLHLDYDLEVFPLSTDPNPQAPKIRLIQLREFALINHVWNASWPLSFLTRLEAPNVDLLHIRLVECDGSSGAFVECLADGGDKATPRPIFPSVTRLKIMPRPGDATPLLKTLLRAHPRITLLEIPSIPLDALLVEPWLAPNLQHLFVEGRPGSELKKVVDARAEAKLPLKAVYSDPSSGTLINPADREYLSSKVEFKFVQLREGYRVVRDVPSG